MTAVSLQCKVKNHHPEWSNVSLALDQLRITVPDSFEQLYNTTFIRWTTHKPRGLSSKDLELAAVCDALARDFGEIAQDPKDQDAGASSQLFPRKQGPGFRRLL